jgi:hypothetical protein
MSEANPEIGGAVATGGYKTNYHHGTMIEQRDRFNALVVGFLSE